MVHELHLESLRKGAASWNAWRNENPRIRPDLSGADLRHISADLREADFKGASLARVDLSWTDLRKVDFANATLVQADLSQADLRGANLANADMSSAKLSRADLSNADLSGANFNETILVKALLDEATITGARFTSCLVHGITTSGAQGKPIEQANLVVYKKYEDSDLKGAYTEQDYVDAADSFGTPQLIAVDHLKTAQLIDLLIGWQFEELANIRISNAVPIIGHFTETRLPLLNETKKQLRRHRYIPILFDFDGPITKDIAENLSKLARLCSFTVVDITILDDVLKKFHADPVMQQSEEVAQTALGFAPGEIDVSFKIVLLDH
jgi:uncharacterized protein YjbI with pentapeptide repeats